MGRQTFVRSADFPYHITARSHNKERYNLPLPIVWSVLVDSLWLTHHFYGLRIHAFVLMPNHFHLIASSPALNLSESMQYFMSQSAREINNRAGSINQIHGSRYFRCLINSSHYYYHAYKYVYRNPVKADLAARVEEYPFSTLRMRLGMNHLELPLESDELLMDDISGTVSWLNSAPAEGKWRDVKMAFRHGTFSLPKIRSGRKPNDLEIQML